MSKSMSPEEIRAARVLAEKASPGDEYVQRNRYEHGGGRMYREEGNDRTLILDVFHEGDREFYFAARTLVPALCDSVEEAQREIAVISTQLAERVIAPDVCPFSRLPFFMAIDGLATYGGPHDSYTIPERDEDGALFRRHYDHDEGAWDEDHDYLSCCVAAIENVQALEARAEKAEAERDEARDKLRLIQEEPQDKPQTIEELRALAERGVTLRCTARFLAVLVTRAEAAEARVSRLAAVARAAREYRDLHVRAEAAEALTPDELVMLGLDAERIEKAHDAALSALQPGDEGRD